MSDAIESEGFAAEAFDATDRPPAGTECARCRKHFSHFCPAKGYAGELALCLACGAGETCGQTTAVLRVEQSRGRDEFEADERGLHGEGRSVAITDEGRVSAPEVAASDWKIKAELSAANLIRTKRVKRIVVTARRKQGKRLEAEQDAGRRRRMSEVNADVMESSTTMPAGGAGVTKWTEAEARKAVATMYPASSAAELEKLTGWSSYFIYKWVGEAKKGAKPGKPSALKVKVSAKGLMLSAGKHAETVKAAAVVCAEPEAFVQVRVPVSAMDRLFAMLPVGIKGRAVEKLLAELGA